MAGNNNEHLYEEIGPEKPYEWRMKAGAQSQPINNDHVIEAHYCQPAAKGLTLNTPSGRLYIDFDTLRTDDAGVTVERLSFLLPGETEPVVWYYRGEALWREFGAPDAAGASSSVASDDIERQFAADRQGSMRFSAGSASYSLDFSTMTQTNLTTGVTRNVRRRPKFNHQSIQAASTSSLAPSGGVKWEFLGYQDVWTEYQANTCSLDSADIERRFQQDPSAQLYFKANGYSYMLDLAGMFQINEFYGTTRPVRRRLPSSGSAAAPRWQFRDINRQWKDYEKVSGHCSVSGADIEQRYQQDPSGVMRFTTLSYSYDIDFAAMTQTNLLTGKSRRIRRLDQ